MKILQKERPFIVAYISLAVNRSSQNTEDQIRYAENYHLNAAGTIFLNFLFENTGKLKTKLISCLCFKGIIKSQQISRIKTHLIYDF